MGINPPSLFDVPPIPALNYGGFSSAQFFAQHDIGSPLRAIFMACAGISLVIFAFILLKSLFDHFVNLYIEL